ncbi:MAG: metalloprotease RseP [Candidatus Taylorbacteria bacterium]|nr:metalloprotease RseP [Candidatus Taylorbacteria bacterium]
MHIIIFLLVLAVLIFVHELGHFVMARAFGIRVDEFALGFGPKIYSKKVMSAKHGETAYSLNLIPFGGYVKIFGENPDEDSLKGPDAKRSFVNKPKYVQAAVLVAGVIFNFLFAWAIFGAVFMAGFPASTDSYPEYASRITDNRVLITSVAADKPAAAAGIKPGDELVNADGSAVSVTDFQNRINASGGKPVAISYKHLDLMSTATVIPTTGIIEGRYGIGIQMSEAGTLKLPIHLAIWEGGRLVIDMIQQTAVGIYNLIATSLGGKGSLSSVTGIVGIEGMVKDATDMGFSHLLAFVALISINLGVLNLVPFPALDGGRLLFVIIEAVSRRSIKPSVANAINAVGFCILILLMVVVTWHDIATRWFVK